MAGQLCTLARRTERPLIVRGVICAAVRDRLVHPRALVVISDHDRARYPRGDDPPKVVEEGKMDVEPRLLAMVATVASNSQWENDCASREVENFRAIELNKLRRVFVFASTRDDDGVVLRFVVGSRGSNARRKLPLDSLSLRCRYP